MPEEQRLGFVGIIVDNREQSAEPVNAVLSRYADAIVARVGIPYSRKGCCVITLVVDTTSDELGALTGKLGVLPGVSVKSALAKGG